MFLARIKFLAIHKLTSDPRVIRALQKPRLRRPDTHFVSIIQHLKHWDSVYNLFAAPNRGLLDIGGIEAGRGQVRRLKGQFKITIIILRSELKNLLLC